MSILDAMMEQHETRTVQPAAMPYLSDKGMRAMENVARVPFRGQLKMVRGYAGDALLERAKLNWTVSGHTPVVNGTPATDYKAIVRDDTGDTLAIAGKGFQFHQNTDLLSTISDMVNVGDAEMLYAGPVDDGRKVVAVARLAGEFELPNTQSAAQLARQATIGNHAGVVTDRTQCLVVITGGHKPGSPFTMRGMGFRLWCLNGAYYSTAANARFRLTHRSKITDTTRANLASVYESIREQFAVYGRDAQRLQATEASREQTRLYVAELLMPGMVAKVQERLAIAGTATPADVYTEVAQAARGREVINGLIRENKDAPGFARQGKALLDAIVNQVGGNGDNLWNAYNGVTYHVDHVAGRNAESGINSAMFGRGSQVKERALVVARQFAR